jgi:CheY-like chemotaxis protein
MTSLAPKTTLELPNLSRKADGGQRRILYAEDQVSSRIVTKAMLEKMGFLVDAVDDGEVAVELARESLYDIILLDIEMPVMDGVTAARIIRSELTACKDTPILALSAFLADSTEHTQWRDAFDSAVPKPANSNELQRAMLRAMSRQENIAVSVPSHDPVAGYDPAAGYDTDTSDIWGCMKDGLPKGMLRVLAFTAMGEMQHQALAMAAARESGDLELLRKYRHTLKGLALNFGVKDLDALITATKAEPRSMNVSEVFASIENWRQANALT